MLPPDRKVPNPTIRIRPHHHKLLPDLHAPEKLPMLPLPLRRHVARPARRNIIRLVERQLRTCVGQRTKRLVAHPSRDDEYIAQLRVYLHAALLAVAARTRNAASYPPRAVCNAEADCGARAGDYDHGFVRGGVVVRLDVCAVPGDPLRLPAVAGEEVEDCGGGEGGGAYEGGEEAGVVEEGEGGVGD